VSLPLGFHNEAICLSGTTGSKLKTEIVANYYRFWLNVVHPKGEIRGGKRPPWVEQERNVFIVDMNAGSGELYIEDADETILGSAGHALDLAYGSGTRQYDRLHLILVESDQACRERLLRVAERRWPETGFELAEQGLYVSADKMAMVVSSYGGFVRFTKGGTMAGISLFYFDPLLSTEWDAIDAIAEARITSPYRTGTEFLVFFFTSDWVKGRTGFASLPKQSDESQWSAEQRTSAARADQTYGDRRWLQILSSGASDESIMDQIVMAYKKRLRKWFRFVQPLPFVPKPDQVYHIFCCSNYETGTKVITRLFEIRTRHFGIREDARQVYPRFKRLHRAMTSRGKPPEWKVLWYVIKNHIDGLCDHGCKGLKTDTHLNAEEMKGVLGSLKDLGYLKEVEPWEWPWSSNRFPIYQVDWDKVRNTLGVTPPSNRHPLLPNETKNPVENDIGESEYVQGKLE